MPIQTGHLNLKIIITAIHIFHPINSTLQTEEEVADAEMKKYEV